MTPDLRIHDERRTNDYPVWTDQRHAPRRVSPAVGELAIQDCARLRAALVDIVRMPQGKLADDNNAVLAAVIRTARAALAVQP